MYRQSGGVHSWNTSTATGTAGNAITFTQAMTLDASGNLGIGTTSPSQKLDVRGGSIRFGDTATPLFIGKGSDLVAGGTAADWAARSESGSLLFATAGTERMRLDSSGNLGLGVVPSAWNSTYFRAFQIANNGAALSSRTSSLTSSSVASLTTNVYNTYSAGVVSNYLATNPAAEYRIDDNLHKWFNAPSGTASNPITFTQAMTLDASGNLLVGQTAQSQTTLGFSVTSAGIVSTAMAASTGAANSYHLYSTGAGAYRFYVSLAGTVFATSTTITGISDVRLKENIRDLDDGLDKVMALQPRKFDWKANKGKGTLNDRGFIAQEFETVFPDMIEEWKDPAPEGEKPYKAVNANLIPTLVKAIQEQQAMIEALTTRLAALEAK
jgi:hypothetical protein